MLWMMNDDVCFCSRFNYSCVNMLSVGGRLHRVLRLFGAVHVWRSRLAVCRRELFYLCLFTIYSELAARAAPLLACDCKLYSISVYLRCHGRSRLCVIRNCMHVHLRCVACWGESWFLHVMMMCWVQECRVRFLNRTPSSPEIWIFTPNVLMCESSINNCELTHMLILLYHVEI